MRAWAGIGASPAAAPAAALAPGGPRDDPAVSHRAVRGGCRNSEEGYCGRQGAKIAAMGLSPTKDPVQNGFIDGRPGFMRTRKGEREIAKVFLDGAHFALTRMTRRTRRATWVKASSSRHPPQRRAAPGGGGAGGVGAA